MQRPRWSLRRARALVGTKFQLIAGLVGFVLVAWLVELVAGIRAVNLGTMLAAVMAAIPAVLWLGFFYLMDRHEPEPKQLVAGVCVLGALIAGPLADFVQYQAVPPVALTVPGLSAFSVDRVIHAMLVVGGVMMTWRSWSCSRSRISMRTKRRSGRASFAAPAMRGPSGASCAC